MLGFITILACITAWWFRKLHHQTVDLKYVFQSEELMEALSMGVLEGKISSEHSGYTALYTILTQARTRIPALNFWTIWGSSFAFKSKQREMREKWEAYRALIDDEPFLVEMDAKLHQLFSECLREKHAFSVWLIGTPLILIFSMILNQRDFRMQRMLENYSIIGSGEMITC